MAEAIYARYSSHAQDEGTSIEVQLEVCERAAGRPCRHYIDRARTGRAVAGRDALRDLMRDAEAGQISRVWVYKFDRLGRSSETHTIVADLEDFGVEVVSATEGKEELARGIQLVVAQHYSKALAERTRDGLQKRFEQGAWTGGHPPYGYQVVDAQGKRRVAIQREEADVVRMVFRLYLRSGMGLKGIARHLEQLAIPTRKGARWSFTTVRGILTNPLVIGRMEFNRRRFKLDRRTGRRVPVARSADEVITQHDDCLRLISDEDFEAVQQRLSQRHRGSVPGSGGRRQMHTFSGLIQCGCCGAPFYARKSFNSKARYVYYVCRERDRFGRDTCDAPTVREDQLMDRINQVLGVVFENADRIVERAIVAAEKRLADDRVRLQRYRKAVESCNAEMGRFANRVTDPALDAIPEARAALYEQMANIKAERDRYAALIDQLADQAQANTQRLAADVRAAMEEARQSLANVASPDQLRHAISELIGPFTVQADGSLAQRKEKPLGELPKGLIAGDRSVPLRLLRDAFWQLQAAA